jgi:hypothetical protein
MFQRLAHLAIVIIAALATPSLIAHVVATSGESAPATTGSVPTADSEDDGWRLTRNGWEQLSPRVVTTPATLESPGGTAPVEVFAAVPSGGQASSRWDMHPAALTLLLVLGAISAFCLFPNERNSAAARQSQTVFW